MSLDEAAPSPESLVEQAGRHAKVAAPAVASLPTSIKNAALHDLADALLDEAESIVVDAHSLVLLRHGLERRFDLAIVGRAIETHRSAAVLPLHPGDRAAAAARERRL